MAIVTRKEWESNQEWEKTSWGNDPDLNHDEAKKQIKYANLLGIDIPYDANGKSIIDFGCGPISLLLRTSNFSEAVGLEPLNYGEVVSNRYSQHGIKILQIPLEDYVKEKVYDEAWLYNVLEHVIDPIKCLENVKNSAKKIRIFEWIDIPPSPGHPHTITKEMFIETLNLKNDEWKIISLNESGLVGQAILVIKDYSK
jgi:2-polyprenyl-3-methyl-5-hydroxy-6-metoxy-1,4-benzoquinol methylase